MKNIKMMNSIMKDWLTNAFAIPQSNREYSQQEHAILDKVAKKVHARRMVAPAIIFLESVKPLNFIASQAMVFFQPIVSSLFNTSEYELFARLLEERSTLEVLLSKIEDLDQDKRTDIK